MKNDDRLQHALHNEKVNKHLKSKPDFLDWVVTTAFYSAIHFVSYKIFPLDMPSSNGKIEYSDFNMYYRYENTTNLSRHEILVNLVKTYIPEISRDYVRLKETCFSARYSNYDVGRKASLEAEKRLKRIKAACYTTK